MASGVGGLPFINYPETRRGPSVPYKNEDQVIPVFRGTPLVIGASLISNIGFIQSYFWRGAGFGVIREIPNLDQYPARYDPTVTPVYSSELSTSNAASLPVTTARRNGDVGYYTSADYHTLYKSGDLTPTAVVDAILSVVRRDTNPPGKHSVAFLECAVDKARAAAAASTQRYKDGQPLGPLDGIPVTVKDEVHMEGYRRTLGTKMDFTGENAGSTSWCVKKWEEAGAIVIAKSTMHELGLDTTNNNPNFGTPRNPHNPSYYCGGSSGGSAYAVGAGIVPIALGADGGGSIRLPSSFCGVWGLKPSHSRVSGFPTVSLASTVGVLGPIASSIDDLALAYRIMATPANPSEDPKSAAFPNPLAELTSTPPESRPKNKTIGIMHEWLDRAEPPVRAVFDKALDFYRSQNYAVVDITIPYIPEGARAHVLTIMAEIASALSPNQIRNLTAPNKVLVTMGMNQITGQDFLAAQRLRGLIMSHLAYLFQQHPGLLIFSPTSPIPGWKIAGGDADLSRGVSDGKSSVRNMEYVWLANFTGCPSISCPAGYAEDNRHRVPIGIMAMGEWGSEEDLIAFARDGEGILDLEGNRAAVAELGGQATGLTIPRGMDAAWEDVVANAKKVASS
ncbi:amidase signature domain-containing protein [Aspergillus cavernicola]|uniref:Amidase signature domain-containing protein n=1 Tax=Aspergillus cavernicola TaxID=176166 RepID=A0ABR4I8R6_9EURO